MAKLKINDAAKTIEITSPSKNEFFLIHGYTGSPTDFNKLGIYLNKRFKTNVKIMRIVGHGVNINELDNLSYNDFLEDVEKELKKDIKKGRKIILGGLCLGGLIAFDLASRYPIKGVFSSSTSLKYPFPINILKYLVPLVPKKHLKKPITNYEKKSRKGTYNYPFIHLRGFKVVDQGKKKLNNLWPKITAPCLILHSNWDTILHHKGDNIIRKNIGSKKFKAFLFRSDKKESHNIFFSPYHKKAYKLIGDFFAEIIKENELKN